MIEHIRSVCRPLLLILCLAYLSSIAFCVPSGESPPPDTPSDFLEIIERQQHSLNYSNIFNFRPPRNISDFYKGVWESNVDRKPTQEDGQPEDDAAHATSGKQEGPGPKLMFEFTERSGHLLFQIVNKPTPLTNIDVVQGEMVLRNGIWTTDKTQHFVLQGLYFWNPGDLFLIANPVHSKHGASPIIQDFMLTLKNDSTVHDAIAQAGSIPKLLAATNSSAAAAGMNQCYFQILFKAKPSPFQLDKATRNGDDDDAAKPIMDVKGIMHSPNCDSVLVAEVSSIQFDTYYRKATNYVIMVTFVTCIQILLLIKQMEATNTQSGVAKVSLLTIGAQAVMDSYLCLIHLTAGIVIESVFNPYATAAFFKFVLFSIFEMRYLLLIFKARNPETFAAGWRAVRRKLGQLYIRFYTVIFTGFVVVYYFHGMFYLGLFMLYSIWIPQIFCNATQFHRNALLKKYVVGMTLTRLCIPMYFYGCPYNFLHVQPNYNLLSWLAAYLLLQVFVLFTQDLLGPRWFLPRRFLPDKYDYQRPVHVDAEQGESKECVICMSVVLPNQRDYMVTPCNHLFHQNCLEQWMEFKMECPTCRRPLPYP